jgi:hypothetical protein
MINFNFSRDDLSEIISGLSNSSKNNISGNCPYCAKEGHFFINVKTWLWDCKKCGESGNLFKLLSFLNLLYKYVVKTIDINKLTKLNEVVLDEEEDNSEPKNVKLPIGFSRIYSDSYLHERKFKLKDFYKYKVGKTDVLSKFEDYVIFSLEENGENKGFVSRCVLPKKEIVSKGKLRYINSKNTEFSKLLFGSEELSESTDTLILVEGIFDKKAVDDYIESEEHVGIKCVATFGKKISKYQITKILKLAPNISTVILFYDLDAIKDTKKIAIEMNSFFNKVLVACLTSGKDPDESTKEEVLTALIESQSPVSFKYNKVHIYKL